MKTLRSILAVLAIGLAPFSIAQAHDSFSFGLNIGGGYAPPPVVRYYAPPPAVYYAPPTVYYSPAPRYYEPNVSFRYYDNDYRRYNRGWGRWEGRNWGRDHDGRSWGHRRHDRD